MSTWTPYHEVGKDSRKAWFFGPHLFPAPACLRVTRADHKLISNGWRCSALLSYLEQRRAPRLGAVLPLRKITGLGASQGASRQSGLDTGAKAPLAMFPEPLAQDILQDHGTQFPQG